MIDLQQKSTRSNSLDIEYVLSKFKVDKQLKPNSWQCFCPAHDDKVPSLFITKLQDKILVKCQGGCYYKDVLKVAGLSVKDLFANNGSQPKDIEAIYPYTDRNGGILYELIRYRPKEFRQRRPDGKGKYIYNLNGIETVIYRLPEVLKAVREGRHINIVEGEKDADNLVKFGLIATCNPMGAGKWKDAYNEYLLGAHVIIWPDADPIGISHATHIAKSLYGKAGSIKIVTLPSSFKDVSDWLAAGATAKDLLKLSDETTEWEIADKEADIDDKPEFIDKGAAKVFVLRKSAIEFIFTHITIHKSDGNLSAQLLVNRINPTEMLHYQVVNLYTPDSRKKVANALEEKLNEKRWQPIIEDICYQLINRHMASAPVEQIWADFDSPIPQSTFLLKPMIYQGEPTMLYGDGKMGKSLIALMACIIMTLPLTENPLGWQPKMSKCLYLDWERNEALFSERLTKLCRGLNVPPIYIDYRRCTRPFMDDIEAIQKLQAEHKYNFAVIDSIGAACAGDINAPEVATRFAQALHTLDMASLLIHHIAKGSSDPMGSVYFRNLSSNLFRVTKKQITADSSIDICIENTDNNLGRLVENMGFRINFLADRFTITQLNINDVPEFVHKQTIQRLCFNALKNGDLTEEELISALINIRPDINADSVQRTLRRYDNKFVRKNDKWGLTR